MIEMMTIIITIMIHISLVIYSKVAGQVIYEAFKKLSTMNIVLDIF